MGGGGEEGNRGGGCERGGGRGAGGPGDITRDRVGTSILVKRTKSVDRAKSAWGGGGVAAIKLMGGRFLSSLPLFCSAKDQMADSELLGYLAS